MRASVTEASSHQSQSTEKKVTGAVSGWTTCDCFFALQETDNWATSSMNVPGYVVCGVDHGRTAMLCPREVDHFRRLWVENGRCFGVVQF